MKILNRLLKHYGCEVIKSSLLYEWQKYPGKAGYNSGHLPDDAVNYLTPDNPKLRDIENRYSSFNARVTAPLVWTDDYIKREDILYFRGDNPYVWQIRGGNMHVMAYALSTYYVKSIDTLKLLDRIIEDDYFGIFTFTIDNKLISRDLLDSIMEIYFLEKHLGLSNLKDFTIMDIGAGYGRLAHRMVEAIPGIKRYICADAVAVSTFISDYYLRFRKVDDRVKVVPLDEIEKTLENESVDLAINIHSFPECTLPAIDWWISLLKKHQIKYLFIVPNSGNHALNRQGEVLLTNKGEAFGELIERYGYKLKAKEPKFRDPVMQKYAINPTYYYLYAL